MKNESLFNETVDILVKAYINETLKHHDCRACAVGNIIAKKHYGINGMIPYEEKIANDNWIESFELKELGEPRVQSRRLLPKTINEFKSTGYTVTELMLIEHAFENRNSYKNDEDGYKGLMAVVDVLMDIHQCNDEKVREETKALFVRP